MIQECGLLVQLLRKVDDLTQDLDALNSEISRVQKEREKILEKIADYFNLQFENCSLNSLKSHALKFLGEKYLESAPPLVTIEEKT